MRKPRSTLLAIVPLLAALAVLAVLSMTPRAAAAVDAKGGDGDAGHSTPAAASAEEQPLEDQPLEAYRRELLVIAMDVASMMPRDPHIKNRSRTQQDVFTASLELKQPELALSFLPRIANWRRGAAAAEYARYCARRGRGEAAEAYIKKADAAAKLADQDWRKQQIQLRVAEAQLLLGDERADDRFRERITEDMHRGRIEAFDVETSEAMDVEALSGRLDGLIESGRYEPILNAAKAYVRLYERVYEDAEARQDIEAKLRRAYVGMGGAETLTLLMDFAKAALANDDASEALRFLEEAETLASKANWPPHQPYEYEFKSELAELRAEAGDAAGAAANLSALMQRYEEEGEKIVNVWRADALRAVAEAYVTLGRTSEALSVYERAVTAGMVNPNGWPRATDLAETCVSLALRGVEPSDNLLHSIHQAKAKLGPPW